MDYQLLVIDPLKAHHDMVLDGDKVDLFSFVRDMAKRYNICLTVFPRWQRHVDRWKMIGKMLSDDVVLGDGCDTYHKDESFINMSQYSAHFRSAHLVTRFSGQYLRGGCLVNKHLLLSAELIGFQKLVDEYNSRVKEIYSGVYEFVSIREWMQETHNVSLVN